jgi:hypothetical protein
LCSRARERGRRAAAPALQHTECYKNALRDSTQSATKTRCGTATASTCGGGARHSETAVDEGEADAHGLGLGG